MALIYNADLAPGKLELMAAWLPSQPWWSAGSDALQTAGAYRFDDPDGNVGMETHLLRLADGQVAQVPLTYRGAPLDGAQGALVGTMQHSVLGQRWVYDACFDPVYANALAATILTGGRQAVLEFVTGERRESTTKVTGSGRPDAVVPPVRTVSSSSDHTTTTIRTNHLELVVLRRVPTREAFGVNLLTGTWPSNDEPTVLAWARSI